MFGIELALIHYHLECERQRRAEAAARAEAERLREVSGVRRRPRREGDSTTPSAPATERSVHER